jgi:amidase
VTLVRIYVRSLTVLGYLIGTVPLGTIDYNGRPFGLAIIAKAGREDLIIEFMSAFEAVPKERPVPPQLVA